MFDLDVVELSRLQFAVTALYHFLFVPLTIGLSMLMVIMEATYVMTRKKIWQDMTKFWGTLFGINFAMGVATGITMEFQFGTNWAYYSHYVGDIFGVPLAIEGLMAFFLESTFVGLFFFGWNRLSQLGHLLVTCLVAIGSNLSALWILIANGWMQNPVGAAFNLDTMRMELTSISEVFFNPVAQAKFVHTVAASYVTGAVFVLAISAWYMLKGRNVAFAKRSFAVAASFGLASSLSVVVLGDESGYVATEHQKMKVAAIEAMWNTELAPAGFTLFGFPDVETRETHAEIKIPALLGLIATRSLDETLPGINDLVLEAEGRIGSGVMAYSALQRIRAGEDTPMLRDIFEYHQENLGYGLLLIAQKGELEEITWSDIHETALSTIPNVPLLFWSFRIMVVLGLFFIALFAASFWVSATYNPMRSLGLLRLAFWSLPLPWVAAELGWIVAEVGRQPWAIEGILPTALGVSSVSANHVAGSLLGFVLLYTGLLLVDVFLMRRYIKLGPDGIAQQQKTHPQTAVAGGISHV